MQGGLGIVRLGLVRKYINARWHEEDGPIYSPFAIQGPIGRLAPPPLAAIISRLGASINIRSSMEPEGLPLKRSFKKS